MNLFDVYPLFDVDIVKAKGSWLWDKNDIKYLDFYGGHAVISVGHSHPHYQKRIKDQLDNIAFYSNSIKIPIQNQLATKLGEMSNYQDYSLFLCNSGAEANENALKLASFQNKRKKVIAFEHSFHGRTSLAVATTNDSKIQAEINQSHQVEFLPLNDIEAFDNAINESICAVIIEGIQGVAGIKLPSQEFLKHIRAKCDEFDVVLILDEVQSGFGRSSKFFAHQFSGIKADIISMAKGMGNGFPVAGILISDKFEARFGMLGTTFGGNYLACAASLAVLEIIESENLLENAKIKGDRLKKELSNLKGLKEYRAEALMIGLEMDYPINDMRNKLLSEYNIFTGSASCKNTIRLLPALNISDNEIDFLLDAFFKIVK